ncbi:hypothetical protein L9F63_020529, partial [Diploptera punctata]
MERNSGETRRRDREKIMVQEGIELWKQKKQNQWTQKIQDQRELRDMLSKYSPWGRPGCGAPNSDGVRKRNMHLQGLFAEEEKKNLGVVLGRSWGGTPQRGNSGVQQKQQHTAYKVDPILRFQFNEPVRKCVDNVLRYKKDVQQQQKYKQELVILKSLVHFCQMLGGVELVPLLARRRAAAERHPLSSTDVTKTRNVNGPVNFYRAAGTQKYTQELSQQIFSKQQRVQFYIPNHEGRVWGTSIVLQGCTKDYYTYKIVNKIDRFYVSSFPKQVKEHLRNVKKGEKEAKLLKQIEKPKELTVWEKIYIQKSEKKKLMNFEIP